MFNKWTLYGVGIGQIIMSVLLKEQGLMEVGYLLFLLGLCIKVEDG